MIKEKVEGGFNKPSSFENNLSLSQTLDCGQAFRWQQQDDYWKGTVGIGSDSKTLEVKQDNLSEIINSDFWSNYFDLELDYGEIKNELSKISPIMKKACEYASGIRILNQDYWETLCSFIISQNNNIKRIKGIVERLSVNYGNGGFPSADTLAGLDDDVLRKMGLGFRSKYIHDASEKVASGEIQLYELKKLNIKEAKDELMRINGVGPKVADCTLLFGFHRLECFPMDVWIKRVMETFFPGKDSSFFGPFAGVAQQYLFHYARTCSECSFN